MRVDPLFTPEPLREFQLVMVAYGTSDELTENRVADEIITNPALKALYDEKLEDSDRMEIPHRFDLELERVDPVQIRPCRRRARVSAMRPCPSACCTTPSPTAASSTSSATARTG